MRDTSVWDDRVKERCGIDEMFIFKSFERKIRHSYISYHTKRMRHKKDFILPSAYKKMKMSGKYVRGSELSKELERISLVLGISKQEVSEIYHEALKKIKAYIQTRRDLKDSLLEYYLENNIGEQ